MVDRPKKRQGITSEILLPAARRQEWLGCFWERWSFLGEQTQLLLWAAGGTCSGDWDEASVPGVALVSLEQHQPGGRRSSRHFSVPCAPPAPVVVRMVYSRRF